MNDAFGEEINTGDLVLKSFDWPGYLVKISKNFLDNKTQL